jgi:hypothetical protein
MQEQGRQFAVTPMVPGFRRDATFSFYIRLCDLSRKTLVEVRIPAETREEVVHDLGSGLRVFRK